MAANAAGVPRSADGAFNFVVVAAFCLNHLTRPGAALREARRVGRGLAASAFAPGWTHPAKRAVDGALRPFGFQPPAWYRSLQRKADPAAQDPARLADQAAGAGFADVRVRTITVPTGLSSAAQLASWRLGLARVAPFLRSLDAAARPRGAPPQACRDRSAGHLHGGPHGGYAWPPVPNRPVPGGPRRLAGQGDAARAQAGPGPPGGQALVHVPADASA